MSSSSVHRHSTAQSSQKNVGKQKVVNLSVPVSSKRVSIASNKSLLPPLPPIRTSGMNGPLGESFRKGKVYNNENFDDGIMFHMSSSNLSFDIMDCSNTGSDQASVSCSNVTKTDNANDDNDQRSIPFYFT